MPAKFSAMSESRNMCGIRLLKPDQNQHCPGYILWNLPLLQILDELLALCRLDGFNNSSKPAPRPFRTRFVFISPPLSDQTTALGLKFSCQTAFTSATICRTDPQYGPHIRYVLSAQSTPHASSPPNDDFGFSTSLKNQSRAEHWSANDSPGRQAEYDSNREIR